MGGQAVVMAWLLMGGASLELRDVGQSISSRVPSMFLPDIVATFVLLLFLVLEATSLPIRFYQTFVLERRYGLSSAPFRVWAIDHLKGALISLAVGLVAAEAVYFAMSRWPRGWWIAASAGGVVAVLIEARLAPVVVLPVFYRFKPLDRASLHTRLVALSERAGLPVLGVYEWSLGAKTRRANAALVGAGRTRRILLSDTLLADYTDDEIEVILAHELGHHAHGDIRSGLLLESTLVVTTVLLATGALHALWRPLGLTGPADVGGLPLLLLVAGLVSYSSRPIINAWSRRNERRADRFALAMTARPDAFVSAMRRLAAHNLAEERPSAAALWFFHTHPRSISASRPLADTHRGPDGYGVADFLNGRGSHGFSY
jgi:STE24 endopeptidase